MLSLDLDCPESEDLVQKDFAHSISRALADIMAAMLLDNLAMCRLA